MRLLVDTNVYSRAMRGDSEATALLRRADELILCPVVTGELLAGFASGRHGRDNRRVLREFIQSPRVRLTPITFDTGEFYGRIFNDLRKAGHPIPTNDIWIAACAMQEGAHMGTADGHFLSVPGLICEFLGERPDRG